MAPFGHQKMSNQKAKKKRAKSATELSNSATEL